MRLPSVISRTILFILFLGTVGFGVFVLYNPHPCVRTLPYTVGRFDDRFGISQTEFREVIDEAVAVWETEAGQDLFRYSPDAAFTVNLIFDERQQRADETQNVRSRLNQLSDTHENTLREYRRLKQQIESLRAEYEPRREEYEQKLAAYNDDVSSWNDRGGAPPSKRDELEARRTELSETREQLQEKVNRLNALNTQINQLASQEKNIVKEFENTRETYGDRHGDQRQFEQGHANGSEINIYQFNGISDLRLVLTHELGHALGIGHVDERNAVMHYLMKDQSLDPIKLTEADKRALPEACSNAGYFDGLPF